jgi:all-trans-retinol 13,14-reductase
VFQVGPLAFNNQAEFAGLWLVGASTTTGHGVAGATASGLLTARRLLKCHMRDLLKQNGPPLAVYPAEDVAQWPERYQQEIARRRDRVGEQE